MFSHVSMRWIPIVRFDGCLFFLKIPGWTIIQHRGLHIIVTACYLTLLRYYSSLSRDGGPVCSICVVVKCMVVLIEEHVGVGLLGCGTGTTSDLVGTGSRFCWLAPGVFQGQSKPVVLLEIADRA
jgi:hypothetical protein